MPGLRERDLQRLALKLHDAMTETLKKPRPSSGVSDAAGKPPIDTARYKKGVQAAIAAFHNAYIDQDTNTAPRDPAGQAEKVDEGGNPVAAALTSARDQRKGDRMAAEGDPEYQDEWADYEPPDDPEDDMDEKDKPPYHTDGLPRVSRAGRDMSRAENDAVRHAKPNTRRFAQARDDQAAYSEFFSDKPKASKVMRAAYKCSKCGESQVVRRYAVTEVAKFNALRHTNARCSECGGNNIVAAPRGYAFTTEAEAIFQTRYRRERL